MRYTRIFLVQLKLSDYIRKIRNEKNLSLEQVSVKSGYVKGTGEGISPSYLGKIENDDTVNPTTPYLKAIAKGLGVSEHTVLDIARGSSGETPLYKRFAELFEKLPENRQKDILMIAEVFATETEAQFFTPNYSKEEETFSPDYGKVKQEKAS